MSPKAIEFSEKDIPDLTGYVAIVTGGENLKHMIDVHDGIALILKSTGNAGIGYETANQLALHNARVYIASRSRERVNDAIQKMSQSSGGKTLDLHYLQLDLQDLASVKAAATLFMTLENRLDILINNAGVGSFYKLILRFPNSSVNRS